MRKCWRCKTEKPDSEFYSNPHNRGGGRSSSCKPCDRAAATEWYRKNKKRALARAAEWQRAHPEEVKAHQKKIRARKWTKAFAAYGDRCVCCGETEPLFLTIDHINNDGAKHRKEIGQRNFLLWLSRNNYPPGFQTMCINCNLGKHRNKGICPHEVKRVAAIQ